MFLAAMEATAVSTAMPTVIGDLGGVDLYAWVFTAYMLTSTVSVPIYGKLSDLFGRKPIMLIGLGLFLAGSGLSGVAPNIEALIVFRALQGLGAGAVQTTALTIVGDLFTLKERGRVQGLFAGLWGIAGIAGPLIGGFIVHYTSWRWIFFINLPFGLASTAILAFAYKERVVKGRPTLDWLGAFLLTASVVLVLAAANGLSPRVSGTTGALALALFILVEKTAREPIIPLDLFSQRLMTTCSALSALLGAAMFAVSTYLPLYVQGAEQGSATQAGGALTPMLVGWPLASTLTGRLVPRYGFRSFVLLGSAVAALGTLGLALAIERGAGTLAMYAGTAGLGVGLGLVNTASILAIQTRVPWQRRGIATASNMFFRIIGGTLAVGFLGGYLALALAEKPGVTHAAINALLGPEHGAGLAPETLAMLTEALKGVLAPIFWLVAVMGGTFFAVAVAFPKLELASGSEAKVNVDALSH